MARNVWNGTLGYGLLTFPVTLASAVSKGGEIELHQYAPDGGRIKHRNVSATSGKEVAWPEIRKGCMAPDGTLVTLTDDDFAEAYGGLSRDAKILLFTSPDFIPDLARKDALHIRPGKGGEHAYCLIATALAETGKVAIVEFGIRERKRLAMIQERGGYLLLRQLEWAQDMAEPGFRLPEAEISPLELKFAVELIDVLTGEFEHAGYRDDSRERLAAIVAKRAQGIAAVLPGAEPEKQEMDGEAFSAMLQGTVAQARAGLTTRKSA